MQPTPRSRVRIKSSGPAVLDGTVLGADRQAIHVLGDDGKFYSTKPNAQMKPVDTPIPNDLRDQVNELVTAASRKWKKGDRASLENKGEILHGTIAKGGAKPTMTIDGGQYQISAPAMNFRPGPAREMGPASVMDRWSVRSYSTNAGLSDETTAYSAKIYRDGQLVIHASNRGNGGCDNLMPAEGQTYQVVRDLASDAKQWFAEHGMTDPIEPEDSWISFDAVCRPIGVTAAEFMDEQRRLDASFKEASSAPTPWR